nr:hypothetical protein [Pollutimonas nitritireducens]
MALSGNNAHALLVQHLKPERTATILYDYGIPREPRYDTVQSVVAKLAQEDVRCSFCNGKFQSAMLFDDFREYLRHVVLHAPRENTQPIGLSISTLEGIRILM